MYDVKESRLPGAHTGKVYGPKGMPRAAAEFGPVGARGNNQQQALANLSEKVLGSLEASFMPVSVYLTTRGYIIVVRHLSPTSTSVMTWQGDHWFFENGGRSYDEESIRARCAREGYGAVVTVGRLG